MRLWIVRAGRNGERELDAIASGNLMLGFPEVGDISASKDRAAVAEKVKAAFPTASAGKVRNFSAQLNQFANTIQVGDLVVLPRKLTSAVAVGRVAGKYQFHDRGISNHTRSVEWLRDAVPRDTFGQDLRHSFGAFMTVCEVKRNEALARVQAVLDKGVDPGPLLGKQGKVSSPLVADDEDETDAEEAELDIEDVANSQIVALINSEFAGHALATLIAQILDVEGYTTRVSPPGPDGGVDILAAGGKLGLGEDRICVQVKSGSGAANGDVVLKLMGSMNTSKARTGLLVSIGGVNIPAQKYFDDDFFGLRLWQMTDVLKALFRTYGSLPEETRAKLPLKQVWAPVAVAEN